MLTNEGTLRLGIRLLALERRTGHGPARHGGRRRRRDAASSTRGDAPAGARRRAERLSCCSTTWGSGGGHVRRPGPDAGTRPLAPGGLRYNRFHTTALCSPTRAALLTGRNHHAVGVGSVIELGHRLPRLPRHPARGHRDRRADPRPERLRDGDLRQVAPDADWETARRGPSTAGPPGRASTASTASSAARPRSASRRSTTAPAGEPQRAPGTTT